MKKKRIMALLLTGFMTASMLTGFSGRVVHAAPEGTASGEASTSETTTSDILMIAKQGMFSSGGTVTAPERYEGSQFPEGEEAQDQFFRQMTPNTGDFDQEVDAAALSEVMKDVYTMTGNKSVFVTHSQGGRVGWDVDMEYVSAIVAVEPGGTPEIGSEQYQKLLDANVPIIILFGDYIDNGPADIRSTDFWKSVRDGSVAFAESFNAAGGDCTVVNLPDLGITGNSHFMFQEENNGLIADYIILRHGLKAEV